MSGLEKSQEVKVSSVSNFNSDGNMLLFRIRALISEKRIKNFTLLWLMWFNYDHGDSIVVCKISDEIEKSS